MLQVTGWVWGRNGTHQGSGGMLKKVEKQGGALAVL